MFINFVYRENYQLILYCEGEHKREIRENHNPGKICGCELPLAALPEAK